MSVRLRTMAVAACLAVILAACGEPEPEYLTDPAAVLSQSAVAMAELDSVAFAADFSAGVDAAAFMGLSGGPDTSSAPAAPAMQLNGELNGAVDFASGNATATLSLPSMLGFTAEARVVHGVTYLRMPMLLGDQWQSQPLDESTGSSGTEELTDPAAVTDAIEELAALDGVSMSMGEPMPCSTADDAPLCYVVHFEADLAALAAGAASSMAPVPAEDLADMADGTMSFDVVVGVTDMHWQRLKLEMVHPDVTATATVNFHGFNEPVEVSAPADAVPMQDMPGIPLP